MQEEIKEILNRLEIVARKHTIEICDDGNIETLPASVVDELRLNNYSAKILLDYITNLQEENERLKIEYRRLADEDAWEIADYKSRNEKALEYTNQFINFKTSRIDKWENVELVLETIVSLLKGDNK